MKKSALRAKCPVERDDFSMAGIISFILEVEKVEGIDGCVDISTRLKKSRISKDEIKSFQMHLYIKST